MTHEESLVAGIESHRPASELIREVGLRKIIFHLALSAISIMALYQVRTSLPPLWVALFFLAGTILVLNDAVLAVARMRKELGERELSAESVDMLPRMIRCGRIYVSFCGCLLAFWLSLTIIVIV